MKRFLAILWAILLAFALISCADTGDGNPDGSSESGGENNGAPVTARDNKEIPIPKISREKNGSLTWIYTMSDDMANQRGIFQSKKMAA